LEKKTDITCYLHMCST